MPPKAEIRVVHTGQFSGTTPALIDGLVTCGEGVIPVDLTRLARSPRALRWRLAATLRGRIDGAPWPRTVEWSRAVSASLRVPSNSPLLFMQTLLACDLPPTQPYFVFTDRAGDESAISDDPWRTFKHPSWQRLESRFLASAQHIFVMGPSTAEYLSESGISASRITVTAGGPNAAIPPIRNRRAELPCRFLFIGKEWERKGGPALVAALEQLRDAGGTSIELHVVGCAPQTSDWVTIHGIVPPNEVESNLDTAHIFALPTRSEPFGLVFIEAIRSGLPVLGSTTGNVSWIIGDAGECPDPTNVQHIREAARLLIDHYPLYAQRAFDLGSKKSYDWSWERVAADVRNIVHKPQRDVEH